MYYNYYTIMGNYLIYYNNIIPNYMGAMLGITTHSPNHF